MRAVNAPQPLVVDCANGVGADSLAALSGQLAALSVGFCLQCTLVRSVRRFDF